MAYWLRDALLPLPALAWMLLGVGLPWALVMLPRRDWRSRPLVACLTLAVGPALVTAWMLVLGMIGGRTESPLLTWPNTLVGTGALAAVGWLWMWYKRRTTQPHYPLPVKPLALDERLIVVMIGAAFVLRFLAAVWYPFFEYDPLWVYAYEGKLYALLGYIPESIGYYPQLLPLSYTYAQLAAGQINDHVARAAFPIFHWGAALAAYVLGTRLFTRRTGVYLAGLWTLYPHVADWAIFGDLEIPLTFGFTGAAAFFIQAWTLHDNRRLRLHYAAIAGFFLGVVMWTKPTGGAFILGVGLLVAFEALRVRFNWAALRPRFEVAFVTGLACIPLGAVWYVRNIALGHRAIDFPHPFWLTQAQRSGVEFGWPLLALAVLLAALYTARLRSRPSLRMVIPGVGLVLAGLLPSIISPHRITLLEWVVLAAGVGLLAAALIPYLRQHAEQAVKRDVSVVGWALLLALPYFVVWFMSYSYHYRLSFAIVPLMALPVALTLARWLPPQHGKALNWRYGLPLLLVCLPGVFWSAYKIDAGWDYLWSNELPDDFARRVSTNPALTYTVSRLENDIKDQRLTEPVIVAPGLQRLPFYFPLDDVRIGAPPITLEELEGADFYVFTQEARWLYEEQDYPLVNPVTGSLGRVEVFDWRGCWEDSSFFGCVYTVRPDRVRFREPRNMTPLIDAPTWGGFGQLVGADVTENDGLGGANPPNLRLVFRGIQPAELDYTLYIHLLDADGNYVTGWDSLPAQTEYGHYSTRFWQPDEYIVHRTTLTLPPDITLTLGETYTLRVGMYDFFADAQRIEAVYSDGTTSDGVTLPVELTYTTP